MVFQIQEKSIGRNLWVVPDWTSGISTPRSDCVSVLRKEIEDAADRRTLSFATHYRIVTDRGDPVERWKVRPGRARKLLRRY